MESEIITAYSNYWQKYAEFVAKVKSRVKAESSINAVCAQLGITRNMYSQRLRYPQNWAIEEVSMLARFLEDDTIINTLSKAIELGRTMADIITRNLKSANVNVTFLCTKLATDTSNFYRKQKDPRLWSQQEIEKIAQVVETIKNL